MTVVSNRVETTALERVVFNLKSSKVRKAKLNGRTHLVVPAVMMTEGVHAGSGGAGYYAEAALAESDAAWNHMPIVVYHPNKEGEPVSARTADVLNSSKIGLVLNTKTSGKKQRIEAWIDYKLAKKVDPRIVTAIENGTKVEVSTGIGLKKVKDKGVWNDEAYTWKASHIRPDHLAVLPDQVGACSIADGAGLLQLNAAAKKLTPATRKVVNRSIRNALKRIGVALVANELSFSEQSCAVSDALAAAYGEKGKYWRGWVQEVYPAAVVFYDGQKTWKVGYSVTKAGAVALGDGKTEVVRTTEYKPVSNEVVLTNGGKSVKKSDMIDRVVANSKLSEGTVAKLSDAELVALHKATKPKPAPEPVVNTVVKKVKVKGKPLTRDELLGLLDPKERAVINKGLKAAEKERAAHVETIKKNPKNAFKDEFLANASDELLEGLAAMAAPPDAGDDDSILRADFSGANGGAGRLVDNAANDEEPMTFESDVRPSKKTA